MPPHRPYQVGPDFIDRGRDVFLHVLPETILVKGASLGVFGLGHPVAIEQQQVVLGQRACPGRVRRLLEHAQCHSASTK